MKTREAAVEGRFYPSSGSSIFEQLRKIEQSGRYKVPQIEPFRIFGAVLPHAGHVYSGYQTIPFFQLIRNSKIYPETFVLIHPNHTGLGSSVAVSDAEVWKNSIGEVRVDRELAEKLDLPFDPLAHSREHSAEVIVPFLQYYLEKATYRILPVCMMDQSHESALLVSRRIISAVEETGRSVLILASCDFSHFITPRDGQIRDQHVIEAIQARKPESVEIAVKKYRASVCGYGPIMALMEFAGQYTGDYKVEILARGHSGEVYPSSEVVHYISMLLYQ